MAVSPRTRLSPGDRRAQLLAVASRRFSEQTFDEFSMDELAAAAGVSKGLLYHYFPSKRDLYVATVRQAATEILEAIQPDLSLSPEDRLRTGLHKYMQYVSGRATAYRAIVRGGVGSDTEVAAIAQEVRDAVFDLVTRGLGGAVATGTARAALIGWIGLAEAASLDWTERKDIPLKVVEEFLVRALPALVAVAADPA
jgi:AcrR family transcriptional regulator